MERRNAEMDAPTAAVMKKMMREKSETNSSEECKANKTHAIKQTKKQKSALKREKPPQHH